MTWASVQAVDRAVAADGCIVAMNGFGSLSARAGSLIGSARTLAGGMFRNCDSVLLREFVCGSGRGIVMGILTGNYKDEGTGVAASIGALALSASFREPLLSEADVTPALRRAAIRAHDDIFAFGEAELGDHEFATVMGRRRSMKGLGASLTAIAITDTRLFGLHIGEGRAFLMRNGTTRKLVLEHTLGHTAAHKEAVHRGEGIPGAEWVVLKVFGLSAELPVFDVFRVDVRPGDRVVVGSMMSLADEMLGDGSLATLDAEAMTQALAMGMSTHFPFAPATVGVVSLG